MTRESIRALRPRVARERAIDTLSAGFTGAVRRLARGPLRAVADVYVPFGLYDVTVRRGAARDRLVLGIDLVEGILDLYRFDLPPKPDEIENVATRNCVDRVLSMRAAEEALRSRVRRLAYQRRGFLAAGHVEVDLEPIEPIVHVPYWAGFFGRGESASLAILDAIRCRVEGPKVRRLIAEWIGGGDYGPGSFKYGASRRAAANSVRASS